MVGTFLSFNYLGDNSVFYPRLKVSPFIPSYTTTIDTHTSVYLGRQRISGSQIKLRLEFKDRFMNLLSNYSDERREFVQCINRTDYMRCMHDIE